MRRVLRYIDELRFDVAGRAFTKLNVWRYTLYLVEYNDILQVALLALHT